MNPQSDHNQDVYLDALNNLLQGKTLERQHAERLFDTILTGDLHDAQIGAVLALLRTHIPTADELIGAASAMRAHATQVPFDRPDNAILLDTCGTGGAPKTFNVSTTAALVLSGVQAPSGQRALVAKHGNRSRTGRGSAEVLETLGVNIDATPEQQSACLDQAGVCFCYAVKHHGAIKHAMPSRKAIGIPTLFNALGPLTNPVGADAQLIGVYDDALVEPVAQALIGLGAKRGMVVHSADGLDELTLTSTTRGIRIQDSTLIQERFDPESLGLKLASIEDVRASDADHSAQIVQSVLRGTEDPFFWMSVLTASGALYASGLVDDMGSGIELARDAVLSGRARESFETLKQVSHQSA